MFGMKFVKAEPTTYVIHFQNGQVKRHGAGLAFLYFSPISSIVMIPAKSIDVPFVFNEVTSDFQSVTVQGQFSYRIKDPLALCKMLDFSVDDDGDMRSEDPEFLAQRLTNTASVLLRETVSKLALEEALVISQLAAENILRQFESTVEVRTFGIEVLDFTIVSVKSTPEMARALEARTRETLQRRADEAIYARRNAAVDQERMISENELETEISVEEKKRLVREAKMAADVAVEEQRARLIEQKVENDRKEADSRAYSLDAVLRPLEDADWKILTAAMSGQMKPEMMIATAFRELAENAGKIGELNMTPELLSSLMQRPEEKKR